MEIGRENLCRCPSLPTRFAGQTLSGGPGGAGRRWGPGLTFTYLALFPSNLIYCLLKT